VVGVFLLSNLEDTVRLRDLVGEFWFTCFKCGKRERWGCADLDGPAFKAYYCLKCRADLEG